MTLQTFQTITATRTTKLGHWERRRRHAAFAEAESSFAVHLRGTQGLFLGGGMELGSSRRAGN